MSVSTDVFIEYAGSLPQLVQEVAPVLGLPFRLVPDAQYPDLDRYEAVVPEAGVRVFITSAADFENDGDLDFESYQYFIGVEGARDEQGREKQAREARAVFERLKATRHYALMLVHDTQRKLDEFAPAGQPALSATV